MTTRNESLARKNEELKQALAAIENVTSTGELGSNVTEVGAAAATAAVFMARAALAQGEANEKLLLSIFGMVAAQGELTPAQCNEILDNI